MEVGSGDIVTNEEAHRVRASRLLHRMYVCVRTYIHICISLYIDILYNGFACGIGYFSFVFGRRRKLNQGLSRFFLFFLLSVRKISVLCTGKKKEIIPANPNSIACY